MAEEEDLPIRKRTRLEKLVLDTLGIEELRDYIGELRDEIARVEADIVRKNSHKNRCRRILPQTRLGTLSTRESATPGRCRPGAAFFSETDHRKTIRPPWRSPKCRWRSPTAWNC